MRPRLATLAATMVLAAALPADGVAADPVIAAAGDIARDPSNANFNGGRGRTGVCSQLETSEPVVNAGVDAVLPLADNQYFCGGLDAVQQSYDKSWGCVKPISHAVADSHEYLTERARPRSSPARPAWTSRRRLVRSSRRAPFSRRATLVPSRRERSC